MLSLAFLLVYNDEIMPEKVKRTVLNLVDQLPIKQKSKVYLLIRELYAEESPQTVASMHHDQVKDAPPLDPKNLFEGDKPVTQKPRVHQGPPNSTCESCEG